MSKEKIKKLVRSNTLEMINTLYKNPAGKHRTKCYDPLCMIHITPENNVTVAASVMGRKGGKRRAKVLSAKRRSEIARMGYKAGIAKHLASSKNNAKSAK